MSDEELEEFYEGDIEQINNYKVWREKVWRGIKSE